MQFSSYFRCNTQIRGLTKDSCLKKSTALLESLRLQSKADEFGKNLSGGMKRRLCLGIAIIGDTQ